MIEDAGPKPPAPSPPPVISPMVTRGRLRDDPLPWWQRRSVRFRWAVYIVAGAVAVAGITVAAIVSAHTERPSQRARRLTVECLHRGGHPVYTVDSDGVISDFLTCNP